MGDKTLVMTFLNQLGSKVNITISGVKDALTQAEVAACMDTIIAKNIFNSTGGDLLTKNAATITTKTQDKLTVI